MLHVTSFLTRATSALRYAGALALLAVVFSCQAAAVDEPAATIELWPEGVPNLKPDAKPEVVENGRVFHVHYPSLMMFPPAEGTANGTAVIYCPGGGYVRLSFGGDGGAEGRWLRAGGATLFILKYRMDDYGAPAPLQDVLRAIRIVRSRAAEWNVKPDQIGVFGGSAGGHVAACAATLWDAPEGKTGAPLDAVDARPDFAILLYPVVTMDAKFAHMGSRTALLGEAPTEEMIERYSIEKQVRKDMPPVIIFATAADKSVPVENSLHLYQALRDVGVDAEMHVYGHGSHGSSVDPKYGPTALWPERAAEWMRFHGWLNDASKK